MSGNNTEKNSRPNIIASFDFALKGMVYAIRTERNMRIHMVIAIMVIITSLFLNLTRMELIAVMFAVALVLITELLNTVIELMVNLITEEHHPLAKIIKDMSAGIVLFASICATVVGYLIFVRKEVLEIFEETVVIEKISGFPPYISAVIIFLVLVISLFIKGLKHKQPSLEGGMPSIHTAVAFSLAMITYFLSVNIYVLIASVFLAIMVAQTRLSSNIHNIWEVFAGALLGTSVTLIIFQIIL